MRHRRRRARQPDGGAAAGGRTRRGSQSSPLGDGGGRTNRTRRTRRRGQACGGLHDAGGRSRRDRAQRGGQARRLGDVVGAAAASGRRRLVRVVGRCRADGGAAAGPDGLAGQPRSGGGGGSRAQRVRPGEDPGVRVPAQDVGVAGRVEHGVQRVALQHPGRQRHVPRQQVALRLLLRRGHGGGGGLQAAVPRGGGGARGRGRVQGVRGAGQRRVRQRQESRRVPAARERLRKQLQQLLLRVPNVRDAALRHDRPS